MGSPGAQKNYAEDLESLVQHLSAQEFSTRPSRSGGEVGSLFYTNTYGYGI